MYTQRDATLKAGPSWSIVSWTVLSIPSCRESCLSKVKVYTVHTHAEMIGIDLKLAYFVRQLLHLAPYYVFNLSVSQTRIRRKKRGQNNYNKIE